MSAATPCAHCGKPMADGGAPLPGEGRLSIDRACASCWAWFYRLAQADDTAEPHCHHDVPLSEPCQGCEDQIEALSEDLEEVVD
jgi:hypothetical protein